MTAARAATADRTGRAGDVRAPDLRSPFVVDLRDLGRRPGAMQELRCELPMPGGWGAGVVTVPEGDVAVAELRLESVSDGVLVTGSVAVGVEAECGRCLDPLREAITVAVQELFVYERSGDPDDDQPLVVADRIDLEPLLRDAVVLALPVNPLCGPDCPGLCASCGERLADLDPDHHHDDTDPRWAGLSGLRVDDPTETET
jgi:uncharacterized protein